MAEEQSTPFDAEIWKPVVGWEGHYEVSDAGRVRSLDVDRLDKNGRAWRKKGSIHGQHAKPNGYIYVNLKSSPRKKRRYVHQLVLESFVGPRPDGHEACHDNGDRSDNRLENLRWDTISENRLDIGRMGRHNEGSKTHCDNGHEFNSVNTFYYGPENRWRRCLVCVKDRRKARL